MPCSAKAQRMEDAYFVFTLSSVVDSVFLFFLGVIVMDSDPDAEQNKHNVTKVFLTKHNGPFIISPGSGYGGA